MGVIYLLHFEKPLAHAKHYIGYTENLPERLETHRTGRTKVRIMQVLHERDIGFYLARVWRGDRDFERHLKNCRDTTKRCPICKGIVDLPNKRLYTKHDKVDPEFGLIKVRPIPVEDEEIPF